MTPRTKGFSIQLILQPHSRARILGILLIGISIFFFINQDELSVKIGFSSLLIGLFMMFMITEKTLPKQIHQAQLDGHQQTLHNITKELNLQGNAVFLPAKGTRDQERMFIPLSKTITHLPDMDDNQVFSTGLDGQNLGIALPPTGLQLLETMEQEHASADITLDTVEEHLQGFVGMNLVQSVTLKNHDDHWQLELVGVEHEKKQCEQIPCPICSAMLTGITRAANTPVWITGVTQNGKKTTFTLDIKE